MQNFVVRLVVTITAPQNDFVRAMITEPSARITRAENFFVRPHHDKHINSDLFEYALEMVVM